MEYTFRIQKAIDYIEEHLTEDLSAELVARHADLSSWHFQRIFSATVGQTLKDYIRKRRLSCALLELGSTRKRILDIAIDYQFESQESFSRAFKAMFRMTPGECRRNGIASIVSLSKVRITDEYLIHLYGGLTMQPEFTTVAEKKVVGLGAPFISILSPDRNNFIVIPKLWDDFVRRYDEIPGRVGTASLGLIYCEPNRPGVHPNQCFYLACAEVSGTDDVPTGMMSRTLPSGRYAKFTHRGKLDRFEHTMNYIYGSWLARSGEELRDAPEIEVYDERFVPDSDESELDIYIPIR